MINPSKDTRRAETRNAQKLNLSLQQSSVSAQYPILPEHLDKLINSPWNSDASRQIDLWLWYVQPSQTPAEFDLQSAIAHIVGLGGAR